MSDELSGQEVPPEDLPDSANLSGQEVPPSDLPDHVSLSGQEVPESDLPDSDKSFMQKLGTNLAGPKAGQPFSQEELIAPPENAKELIGSAAGSNLIGLPGAPFSSFWARGAKGALESAAAQGGDEIDRASLGQGDPTSAVAARIAGAAIPGFIIGGITGQRPASSELTNLADKKTSSLLSDMFVGASHVAYGNPSAPVPPEVKSKGAFKVGQVLANAAKGHLLATGLGAMTGGLEGSIILPAVKTAINHIFGDKLSAASRKTIAPMLMRAAAYGPIRNPSQIIQHATDITRGDTAMSKGIESLFVKGGQKAYDDSVSDSEKEKLKDHIESGGPVEQEQQNQQPDQTQGYADGGEVAPTSEPLQQTPNNEIANHWPEQNIMLNATRSRVYNYLNSVRPAPNANKLPFDTEQKDHHKERDYDKEIHLATKPLSILNHIKNGSLVPKQVAAFTAMYPELHQELSKRMTKRITESQLDEEKKPPYHVRQAMSLFMGASLDSTLTPFAMQNAQAVFMKQKAQQAPQSKTSALGKLGKGAQTAEQGREQRLNKS